MPIRSSWRSKERVRQTIRRTKLKETNWLIITKRDWLQHRPPNKNSSEKISNNSEQLTINLPTKKRDSLKIIKTNWNQRQIPKTHSNHSSKKRTKVSKKQMNNLKKTSTQRRSGLLTIINQNCEHRQLHNRNNLNPRNRDQRNSCNPSNKPHKPKDKNWSQITITKSSDCNNNSKNCVHKERAA
jgi:hypothetical protein